MKKIDIFQKVVTLDEFVKMVKKDEIPLVIVMNEVEFNLYKDIEKDKNFWSKFKKYKYIRNLYHNTCLASDENNKYMVLDIIKLTELTELKKIQAGNFIDQENNKSLITYICPNDRIENRPAKIKYLDENDYTNIKTVSIFDLEMSAIKKHLENSQKIKKHIK